MNEKIVKMFFPNMVKKVKKGLCPFCNKKVDPKTEFRNELSRKEFKISGLCQDCQDNTFK